MRTLFAAILLLFWTGAFALDNPTGLSSVTATVNVVWPDGTQTEHQCVKVQTRSCVVQADELDGFAGVTLRGFPVDIIRPSATPAFWILSSRASDVLWLDAPLTASLDPAMAAGTPAEMHSKGLMQSLSLIHI